MEISEACVHQQIPFPQPLHTDVRNEPFTGFAGGSDAGRSYAPSLVGPVQLCDGDAAFMFLPTTPAEPAQKERPFDGQ